MVAEFRLLGDIEVRINERLVAVGHARQRCVLAVLLMEANHTVSADQLIDRVWGQRRLPSVPLNALQTYISLLRRVTASAGNVSITRQSAGYKATVDVDAIDVYRFRDLVSRARSADDDDQAGAMLEEALRLWHGEPFAHLDTPWMNSARDTLSSQRHAARLDLFDVQLRRGEHVAVVAELPGLAAEYPLDERVAAQLMVALYRCGRQADALAHYGEVRGRLAEELGIDPGPSLRRLHQQILRADPVLNLAPASSARASAAATAPVRAGLDRPGSLPVPRQLPADVPGFTGRLPYLADLDRLLDASTGRAHHPGPAVVISALSGTAGVGKTALAIRWAHRVADRFPDGQLYVNLRGYAPDRPMAVAEALAGFLRALGVSGQDIPADADERAARYRSLLAGRRMLVVLDNAGEVGQVRPLLPGDPACVTVVTSRNSLAGLVARDGAVRLNVDPLPPAEAMDLLRTLIGPRVDEELDAAATLAAHCSWLPLALRVAAELAIARPVTRLADLADELADEKRRLDLLDAGGDSHTAVRAVFSWSCTQLPAEVTRVLRLAGLHPGPDFDLHAAAALSDGTPESARPALDRLAQAHLLHSAHSAGPGRYGMHDLLRVYARELAVAQESAEDRQQALTRLFDYYMHTAATAMDALLPGERDDRPRISPSGRPAPALVTGAAAREWLDAERANLVAAVGHAALNGWPGHATGLAATIFRYLDAGGHYPEAIAVHTYARDAARRTGDRAAEGSALTSLGVVDYQRGRYPQATACFRQALPLCREAGDRLSEARALGNLGVVDFHQGHYSDAVSHQQQALALHSETGNRSGAARTLNNLAMVEERQGRYEEAVGHLSLALDLSRETGSQTFEAYAMGNLGNVYRRQGQFELAADHQRQSLALFLETGNRRGEAYALGDLGDTYGRQGDYQQAIGYYEQALLLFRRYGDGSGEAEALNGLGGVLLATGRADQARDQHTTALALARELGQTYAQAGAHAGLGDAWHVAGDPGQARAHWHEALTLYAELGAPEASHVRARLTEAARA